VAPARPSPDGKARALSPSVRLAAARDAVGINKNYLKNKT